MQELGRDKMTSKSLPESDPVSPLADHNPVQPPRAFPDPGVYDRAPMITLLSDSPGAEIHYTTDGSLPTTASPSFDPYRLIPLEEFGKPVPEGKRTYVIRAIAQIGERTSKARTYTYEIESRARDEYISQELAPGIRVIHDFDNDKMYLLSGSQRALLIDAGMGSGDLRGYVESFIGDLPLDVFITHGHPDHIARIGQLQVDCDVYMHLDDLPMVQRFVERLGFEIDLDKIKDVREGFVFDLGDRKLEVYHVPGHSKGSQVLLDKEHGILFSGDAIGSNAPTIVDALWLQMSDDRVDEYLSTLQVFRSKVAGKIKRTYGGHGAPCLRGEAYLDHLEEAAQRLVDQGVEVLTPAPRPSGAWQVVSGDRLSDPNWAAVNVNRDNCLSSPPDQIATLSNLQLKGGSLNEAFKPAVFTYTADLDPDVSQIEIVPTATSRRYAALKINGVEAVSGQPFVDPLKEKATPSTFSIEVVSPDRSITSIYTVKVRVKL
jgi:glyoxylase-like metal-dependent hydrolase (beta-lactamase superfamily II)